MSTFKVAMNSRNISNAYKKNINCCVYHRQNTDAHEDSKWKVFKYFIKRGYSVITEAKFKLGGRADIYVLDINLAVEILHTEKLSNIEIKEKKYPCRVLPITTKEVLESNEEELEKLFN